MNKKLLHLLKSSFIFSIILLVQIPESSAQNFNKCGLGLYKVLKENHPVSDNYSVLIEGDVSAINRIISEYGGFIKFSTKTIVSAYINKNCIEALSQSVSVKLIDSPQAKGLLLNDVMTKNNNVDSAFAGYFPLEQSYDGSNVIIGIIDAPFDESHGDFKDAEGHTRIKYLWDQNDTEGASPILFDYGTEWDSASIEDGICTHLDYDYYYSHGTGVTGVAASSGYAANAYRGVAPNADLILVSLDFGTNFLMNTIDAIAYIYKTAEHLGRPCVINTSFGSYTGSHDGKDITAKTIQELITSSTGRAFVSAAGNGGTGLIHLGYPVSDTTQFTWFKKLSYTNAVYFQIWADSAEFDDVYFSISADNKYDYSSAGSSPLYNILSDYDFSDSLVSTTSFPLYSGLDLLGTIETYAQKLDSSYLIEVNISSANPDYYWRFSTTGEGYFDIYSQEGYTGFSDYVTSALPSSEILPDIIHYKMPDNNQSIVSSWQCLNEVITVGSYVNRDTMTNYYGLMPLLTDIPGTLFISSSMGPTRDGRIKPDITSTGARVLSSGSSVLTSWLISLGAANYISQDGQHYLQNGTSFASPAVTGICALYLQKNPDANWEEIKNAIINNAKEDEFTGDELPNNNWGYGKADAFRTLTGPWGCSAEDFSIPPTSLELNTVSSFGASFHWTNIPSASFYQVAIKKLFTSERFKRKALTNSKSIAYLEPATDYFASVRAFCPLYGFSEWSPALYFTTLPLKESELASTACISIYPNPASKNIIIDGLKQGRCNLSFHDITGTLIMNIQTECAEDIIETDISTLQNGLYTIVIENNAQMITKKLMIIN